MEAVTTVFGGTIHGHVLMSDDFQFPKLCDNPTPEDRAQFVILRLEQFIRDNRTLDKGMSFKVWQSMAKAEIASALADAENSQQKGNAITKRLLFTTAAALVTIGFWGTAVSLNRFDYIAGGIICLIAGVFLFGVVCEWQFRKLNKRSSAEMRTKNLRRVEELNKRIKRLEQDLEKQEEALEKELKAKARAAGL